MNTALDELEAVFQDWRSPKESARDRVPAALLTRARELGGSFSEIEIARRCRLARARLFPDFKSSPTDFVELPNLPMAMPITVEIRGRRSGLITVTLPEGTNLGSLFTALRS